MEKMVDRDPLQEVSEEDIPKLLQLLRCDFPNGIHAYCFKEVLIKWRKKDKSLNTHILAPKGNWKHGVFFYFLYNDRLDGSFYVWPDEGNSELVKALYETNRIKWTDYNLLFSCLHEDVWKAVEPVLKPKWEDHGIKFETVHCPVYWLPWQEAKQMKLEIPNGMYIEDLKNEHSEKINNLWPHKFKGSNELVKRVIRLNTSLGLFTRGDGELVSWALEWYYGGLAAVQTIDEFKRKGCGSAVVQAITRKLGQLGIDVHLNLAEGNTLGDSFYTKLGFRYAFTSVWAYNDDYEKDP